MRFSVKQSISKAACVLGLLGAAFAQTGCAHPMMVQPSVVIQPQLGYPPVYGRQQVYVQPYASAPVVVMPRVVPQVVYSPPVYRPVYGYGYGFGGHHGWGHGGREWHGGREGHDGGWRR